jgi:hypothetical protein
MNFDIMEKILNDLLSYYLGLDDYSLEKHIKTASLATKERVTTINDLKIIIRSRDHNPPHFHVQSNDLRINARFTIENCELMDGEISSKYLKRIKAFYDSPKGKIVLKTIWSKRGK